MANDSAAVPLSVQRMLPRLASVVSPKGLKQLQNFKPTETDTLLTTGMKSGTTWVQQILQQLRSGGDMNFEEICLVFPCIENSYDAGITDLYKPQCYPPQLFQSHMERKNTAEGFGKYIVIVRDPVDSALSLYHFIVNWFFTAEELSADDFVEWFVAKECSSDFLFTNPTPTRHMASWYPYRLDPNVLWLHYEDLKMDMPRCVEMISDFAEIGVGNKALHETVVRQSGLQFMKMHKDKFDSHGLKRGRNEAMGLPRDAGLQDNVGKVRNGKVNEGRVSLKPEVVAMVDQKWREIMEPISGYTTYADMRMGINSELGREFEQPEI